MNNIIKLGLNLFIICAVAALALGATNQITAPVIEQRNIQANNESRQKVLPEATEFKKINEGDYENIDNLIEEVYEGADGSSVVGYTIKVLPKGYGGKIEIIVGISNDGKITGIKTGNMSETPGLGAKASEPQFSDQFKDKEAKKLNLVKGSTSGEDEIQAISGATITSAAVTKGVNTAIQVYNSSLNK
ncbi:RnfABCDGE type electron transport complex subunit G [Romboutsia maritimum]|uniref:Ion-translocating oxidoreductase complex subunit G n=1 Tax=Romboutsia maritimum TaxID=2020948 RepID=A0A371IUA5_9FIRM|nr:RnfABCDGE type electron transport complex subunit G [Romboutsia maritimum]RDY24049.1 RnfABCDGE type electron transport complex subunit G [Romboutsia maritimum]